MLILFMFCFGAGWCCVGENLDPLLKSMQDLIGPQTECYLSYVFRYENEKQFFKKLRDVFCVELIPEEQHHPLYHGDWIELYRITRKDTQGAVCSTDSCVEAGVAE